MNSMSDTRRMLGLAAMLGLVGCYRGTHADPDLSGGLDGLGEAGETDDDGPSNVPEDGELLPLTMQRLTASRYRHAVRDLFGAEIAEGLALEEDPTSDGWIAIGARDVAVSPANVIAYESSAAGIASAAVEDAAWRGRWASCEPSGAVDEGCARSVVDGLGLRLFRRPLREDELDRWTVVATTAASDLGDFWEGFGYALTGMLLSPHFTHIVEVGDDASEHRSYSDYEMASRLSFLLWDTTPDEALLEAAAAGDLTTSAGVQAQVERMLADEDHVAEGLRAFAFDLLQLSALEHSLVSKESYPEFTREVRDSMREASLRTMVDMALHDDREFLAVLEAGFAYADSNLAPYYEGVGPGDSMRRVELDEASMRAGLLTEPSLLAATSSFDATSPTRRGKFVRTRLLCTEIPPPPENVANDLPPRDEGTTRREQLLVHMEVPECAACHESMDPLGFGLEHFDAVGLLQLQDAGKPVDATGQLDGVDFEDARSLSRAVLEHPKLRRCFAEHLYRYATGNRVEDEYAWAVDEIEAAYDDSGGDLLEIWSRLARSDVFRFGGEPRQ